MKPLSGTVTFYTSRPVIFSTPRLVIFDTPRLYLLLWQVQKKFGKIRTYIPNKIGNLLSKTIVKYKQHLKILILLQVSDINGIYFYL